MSTRQPDVRVISPAGQRLHGDDIVQEHNNSKDLPQEARPPINNANHSASSKSTNNNNNNNNNNNGNGDVVVHVGLTREDATRLLSSDDYLEAGTFIVREKETNVSYALTYLGGSGSSSRK